MRYVFAFFACAALPMWALAGAPETAEQESAEGNRTRNALDYLEPRGSIYYPMYGCVVLFVATHDMDAFPAGRQWCLRESDGEFYLRSWRGERGRPGFPDNPDTPEDESEPDVPYTELDVAEREFPSDLARDIWQLWLIAVLEARFPLALGTGIHGTTFEFTVRRHASYQFLTAETWSPARSKPPTWMAELGLRIYDVAVKGLPIDAELRQEVEATRRNVERFYYEGAERKRKHLYLAYALACASLLLAVLGWRKRANAS